MIILRKIVAAASSILLVLLSTPAVVEGTCECEKVCPNYVRKKADCNKKSHVDICWKNRGQCFPGHETEDAILGGCDAYCVCNWFGCNCDGCENAYPVTVVTQCNYQRKPGPGSCGWEDGGCEKYGGYMGYNDIGCDDDDPGVICDRQSPTCYGDRIEDDRRQLMDAKEKKDDGCGDFHYFRSLSADGKRKSLATKYCGGEDQVVREDIYTVLLHEVLLQFNGISPSDVVSYIKTAGGIDQVLTCDLFNKSYGDLDHLTLCENKQPANTKKGKKQKKTP